VYSLRKPSTAALRPGVLSGYRPIDLLTPEKGIMGCFVFEVVEWEVNSFLEAALKGVEYIVTTLRKNV